MPKSVNQKLKLLYLKDILLSKTDQEHTITMKEIIDSLSLIGIHAERKSLYDDFELLRSYGVDVISNRSKTTEYYAVSQGFELAELKLLTDAVQSSKFITHKKSSDLIAKIQNLCSVHEARDLQRQIFVGDRVKNINEEIYYNVDRIYTAIGSNKKISFKYFEYNTEKQQQFRRNGERYTVSPMALSWDNENYYLLAFDELGLVLKHYRVDKMCNIELCEENRDYTEMFDEKEVAKYNEKVFSMFGGKEEVVKLEFENGLIGVALDRFGKDIIVNKKDDDKFTINVKVEVSPNFFGWLAGFGGSVKLLSPDNTREEYLNHIKSILK